MSSPKSICWLVLVALAGSPVTLTLCGQSLSATNASSRSAVSPPALSATLRTEELSGAEHVRRAYVTFGTNRFAFIVPPGFRLNASNPDKIVLVKNDYSCFLTFQVAEPLRSDVKKLEAATCRKLVLHRHPGASILNEHSQSVDGHRGPAFDLQWTNTSGVAQSASVAFVPSPAGVLEFSLLSRPAKISEGQYFFSSLLLSFCSNEGGQLKITRLSDKF